MGTVLVVPQFTPVPVHMIDQYPINNKTGNQYACPLLEDYKVL